MPEASLDRADAMNSPRHPRDLPPLDRTAALAFGESLPSVSLRPSPASLVVIGGGVVTTTTPSAEHPVLTCRSADSRSAEGVFMMGHSKVRRAALSVAVALLLSFGADRAAAQNP